MMCSVKRMSHWISQGLICELVYVGISEYIYIIRCMSSVLSHVGVILGFVMVEHIHGNHVFLSLSGKMQLHFLWHVFLFLLFISKNYHIFLLKQFKSVIVSAILASGDLVGVSWFILHSQIMWLNSISIYELSSIKKYCNSDPVLL